MKLRKKGTNQIFPYSEILAKRSDMEEVLEEAELVKEKAELMAKAVDVPEFKSQLKNCFVRARKNSGTLFYADGDKILVSLDGYVIVPKEDYGKVFWEKSETGKPKITEGPFHLRIEPNLDSIVEAKRALGAAEEWLPWYKRLLKFIRKGGI